MPRRLLAPTATAALLLLNTTAAPAQTPGPMSADQGWTSIKRCAQEDTERARHSCLDRVLREAGVLTDEMHAKQQRRAFGLEDKPARTLSPAATAASGAATTSAATATPSAPTAEALNRRAAEKAPAATATQTTSPASPASAAAAASPASAANPAQPDRLDVDLASVGKATNGRLFVTTTDGAVWLQTESVEMPLPPVAGDRMSIRKGSLGGYRCTIASTHLTYRCARNR